MSTVSKALLDSMCNRLNNELGRPLQYKIGDNIQVGHFHIDTMCGPGVRLAETTNEQGACTMYGARGTKTEVYEYINGILDGIHIWKKATPK